MPVSDFTPTVRDVAAFLRSRTRLPGGTLAGTFNPASSAEDQQTEPTAEQAQDSIYNSQGDIVGALGTNIPDAPQGVDESDVDYDPDAYRTAVKSVWALGAALDIELNYFPEQINTNRSPYEQLLARYNSRLSRLMELINEARGGLGDGGESVAAQESGMPLGGGWPSTALDMESPW